MFIWNWKDKKLQYNGKAVQGTPPACYAVVWSPFQQDT